MLVAAFEIEVAGPLEIVALFENGEMAFERTGNDKRKSSHQQRIEKLEAKLVQKNEVVAELLEEHVKKKKSLKQQDGIAPNSASQIWLVARRRFGICLCRRIARERPTNHFPQRLTPQLEKSISR